MSNFRYTRPDSLPPIVKNLIIINVLVFVAQLMLDSQYDITKRIALYPIMPERLHQMLVEASRFKSFEQFYPYQIATHMFAHGGYMHIIFNMFGLWMFGKVLENIWGPKRFLLFYFACGVGAAALHLAIQSIRCQELLQAIDANNGQRIEDLLGAVSPAVGASGAIMGIFAAFAFLFPNTELYIYFAIPVKAKWAVLGMAAYDIFGGFAGGDNIAHFAHLGGALTGFILVLIWNKMNPKRFY